MDISYLKHDINSLIFKIDTSFEILKDYIKDEEIKEVLDIGISSLNKLQNIINRMILWDKIQKKKLKIVPNQIKPKTIEIETTTIKIKDTLTIDENLFNEILLAISDLNTEKNIEFNKKTLKFKPYINSDIDRFNLEFIRYILNMFEIDTEVL